MNLLLFCCCWEKFCMHLSYCLFHWVRITLNNLGSGIFLKEANFSSTTKSNDGFLNMFHASHKGCSLNYSFFLLSSLKWSFHYLASSFLFWFLFFFLSTISSHAWKEYSYFPEVFAFDHCYNFHFNSYWLHPIVPVSPTLLMNLIIYKIHYPFL